MQSDASGFDWINAGVQALAIFAAFGAGLWASNKAHDRERAIADGRVARALLAELERFKGQLAEHPELDVGLGTHPWVGGLIVEMIRADPSVLQGLMRVDKELQSRATSWLSLRYHLEDIDRRRAQVRFGEAVAGGHRENVADPAMAISQGQLSADYLPELMSRTPPLEEAYADADQELQRTLSLLEAQLKRTADAPVPSAQPFVDDPSPIPTRVP